MAMWINPNLLKENKKVKKWTPPAAVEKVLWGLCECGEVIHVGDSVGMLGDHIKVICYRCWINGGHPEFHGDCAGLKLPGVTLSN